MTELKEVYAEELIDNPFQSRRIYSNIKPLAESIEKHGLIHPPTVRKVGDRYEIIEGCRRVRAVLWLQHRDNETSSSYTRRKITVKLIEATDKQAAAICYSENKQRDDLNPIEEALQIKKTKDTFGWSTTQVAKHLNINRTTANNKLALLDLPEEIQNYIGHGLTERHGRALLQLARKPVKNPNEAIRLSREAAVNEWTVHELNKQVDKSIELLTILIDERVAKFRWPKALQPCTTLCKQCTLRIKRNGWMLCAEPTAYNRRHRAWQEATTEWEKETKATKNKIRVYQKVKEAHASKTIYMNHQGLKVMITGGIGGGPPYGSFMLKANGVSLQRVSSPKMPMVDSQQQAQRNLDAYAKAKGWLPAEDKPDPPSPTSEKSEITELLIAWKQKKRKEAQLIYETAREDIEEAIEEINESLSPETRALLCLYPKGLAISHLPADEHSTPGYALAHTNEVKRNLGLNVPDSGFGAAKIRICEEFIEETELRGQKLKGHHFKESLEEASNQVRGYTWLEKKIEKLREKLGI